MIKQPVHLFLADKGSMDSCHCYITRSLHLEWSSKLNQHISLPLQQVVPSLTFWDTRRFRFQSSCLVHLRMHVFSGLPLNLFLAASVAASPLHLDNRAAITTTPLPAACTAVQAITNPSFEQGYSNTMDAWDMAGSSSSIDTHSRTGTRPGLRTVLAHVICPSQ